MIEIMPGLKKIEMIITVSKDSYIANRCKKYVKIIIYLILRFFLGCLHSVIVTAEFPDALCSSCSVKSFKAPFFLR